MVIANKNEMKNMGPIKEKHSQNTQHVFLELKILKNI
jgi:hypothetical protein